MERVSPRGHVDGERVGARGEGGVLQAAPPPGTVVLALNSGSSSLKFGLYRVADLAVSAVEVLFSGQADPAGSDATALLASVAAQLAESGLPAPAAIGHRIVHGGPALRAHVPIDDMVLQQLEAATAFAPLHMPAALALIRQAQALYPGLPQVACFDTCFHAALPDVARVLPIPRALRALGLQRYGFHGLSCESIVRQLAGDLPRRLVIAHLGNGASVTAVADGRSIDTSMGLTPSGGLIMGTRSGDLDPGLLIYLMREQHLDAEALEALVDHRSGLLGISGLASDMRRLHAAAVGDADARLAIEMFGYAVRKQVAAMAAVLDGIDMLVFTGGIGENDAAVRAAICAGLGCIGLRLDAAPSRSAEDPRPEPARPSEGQTPEGVATSDASQPSSRSTVRVLVLPSQEDEQIARHTAALTAPGAADHPRDAR